MNKHILWSVAIANIITTIFWFALAFCFGKWWIALFSLLTLSTISTPKTKTHMICDGCGRYSHYAADHRAAIEEAIKAGWIRKKVGDKWEDYCPECQAKGLGD